MKINKEMRRKGMIMNNSRSLWLRVGELVEVRSFEEIRQTLDGEGRLDGLPFMPEMLEYSGKRFRVHGRADRTCVETHKARGMNNTVWLENVRCGGGAHDECKIGCLIFWKESWLKRVTEESLPLPAPVNRLADVQLPTRDEATNRYICQSSELLKATYPIGLLGNALTYVKDLWFGNLSFSRLVKVLFIYLNVKVFGRYGRIRPWRGDQKKTPTESLNLEPGEWVEVKSLEEITKTLDSMGRNRGLLFAPEFVEYCGNRYQVQRRADRFVDESTGEVRTPKNTVILSGVTCTGTCRRGCLRAGQLLWREIWLKRTNGHLHETADSNTGDAVNITTQQ